MRMVWIAGWFPHSDNKVAGNFIQRHFHAVHDALTDSDRMELWHFAPCYRGTAVPISIDESNKSIHIIPVAQWKRAGKLVNGLVYYAKVAWFLVRLFSQEKKVDLVHIHAADKIGVAVAALKNWFSFELWLTEHWAIFNQPVPDSFDKRSRWFQQSYRYLWRKVDVVASINENLYQEMKQCLGGEKQTYWFPNVVDMAFVPNEIAPKAAINRIPLSFLHISNGEPRKNIEPLLAAFSKFTLDFPEARLTLIGSDRYIKLGSYHWLQALGRLPTEKLTAYYQKSAAMILVSDAENAPCVITEALCLGVPVITTLVGGIGELTNDSNSIQIPAFQTHEEKAEKIYLALLDFVAKIQTFDSEQISADALRKFHPKQVGQGLVNAYMNQPCVV